MFHVGNFVMMSWFAIKTPLDIAIDVSTDKKKPLFLGAEPKKAV